jgi:hypothetical protein
MQKMFTYFSCEVHSWLWLFIKVLFLIIGRILKSIKLNYKVAQKPYNEFEVLFIDKE